MRNTGEDPEREGKTGEFNLGARRASSCTVGSWWAARAGPQDRTGLQARNPRGAAGRTKVVVEERRGDGACVCIGVGVKKRPGTCTCCEAGTVVGGGDRTKLKFLTSGNLQSSGRTEVR